MAGQMQPGRSQQPPEREERRADLMAMLAASRELGPEMDASLADSYLERQQAEDAHRHREGIAPRPGAAQTWTSGRPLALLILGGLLTAAIVASIVSFAFGGPAGYRGFFPFPWFFLWFLLPLCGWGWWGRRGYYRAHRRYTYEADDGRRVHVYERTRGYGPSAPAGPTGERPYDPDGLRADATRSPRAPGADYPDGQPPTHRV